jgi:iron-sulfur cluster repair protein YtfE (RIC family)
MTSITPPGWALRRLIELHAKMRDDLALLRKLVGDIAHASPDMGTLERLSFNQPGWALHRYCAGFCGFVREHHTTEDTMVFPMLLAHEDGQLTDVIDNLRADHRTLAGLLDEAQRLVAALPGDAVARTAAAGAVERLAENLQSHIHFEERNLAPALNALSYVVSEDDVPPPPAEYRMFRAEIDAALTRGRVPETRGRSLPG